MFFFSLFKTTQCLLYWIWLLILITVGIWSIGAVYYTFSWNGSLRAIGTCTYIFILLILTVLSCGGNSIAALDLSFIELLIIFYFVSISPSEYFNGTKWQTPWAKYPEVTFSDNTIYIKNIRDFKYLTEHDYQAEYINAEINCDNTTAMYVALSHWDNLDNVAHTMLSFSFNNGTTLAFSMETRLPAGVEQGMLPGLYKQYELLPVIATENDIFKLRTNYRKEELYLYRTIATPEQAGKILFAILKKIELQQNSPRFYNSITHNCTTSLSPMLKLINSSFTGDIRLLLNGHSDELLFDLGYLSCREGENFAQLKERRHVNKYIDQNTNYSIAIRTNEI